MRGEIEAEKKVLIIKRILVAYRLRTAAEHRETAQRVHEVHHQSCPVYMSLHRAIDIRTELELVGE